MENVLVVTSSASGAASVSNALVERFLDALRAGRHGLAVIRRDLGADPIPHLTPASVAAIRGAPETAAERSARALSDALIAELRAADLVVIGAPMYNFGMSSTLKAWFDHVLRAGVTFRYGDNGPEGLLKGRKAVVIESRGGLYSEGPAAHMDAQEPHLRTLLGFIGFDDVAFVRAERLAFGPEAAEASVEAAAEALGGLARDEMKLAA